MTNTYLLEVIKALAPEERQEILAFLSNPQFNRGSNSEEIKQLYQIILESAPEFSEALLKKEIVYFRLFAEKEIVAGKLEKIMTDLNKTLRNVILGKRYFSEDNEKQQQLDWFAFLRERGLTDKTRPLLTKLKNQTTREKRESLEQYKSLLIIAEEEHEWDSIENQTHGDLSISNIVYHLDLYYQCYRKELENRYLAQGKVLQLPNWKAVEDQSEILRHESILLQMSNRVHELLNKEMPLVEDFQALMQQLKTSETIFPFETLVQFYTYLRNVCSLLIDAGHMEFSMVLHEIQKDNLDRGLFFVHGEISPNAFINLVQVALRVKEFAWAKSFIEKYKNKIIGGDKDQFFYRFNLAHMLFAEKKYDEALEYMPDAPSTSHYHRTIRRLELKIYYEQQSDLLHFKLFAFRKYVERTAPKKVAASLRNMDLNFHNLLLQVTQSPLKDKKRAEKIIERIQHKSMLSDRAWLLEKARELG